MPIDSEVDAALGVIFTTFEGVITVDDLFAQLAWTKSEPAFKPSLDHLVDTRGATRFEVSSEDLRAFSEHSAFDARSRRAIVASSGEIFGMARMYEMLRNTHGKPDRIRVFDDIADARRWLGIDQAT